MNVVKTGIMVAKLLKRHAPIIMSAGAGIGMVLTYILAIRETEEACEEISRTDEEEDIHSFKMAKKLIKIYAPSFITLVLTLLCVVQSTIISQHRIRDLTASYAALATFTNQYRQKVREIYGDEADFVTTTEVIEDRLGEYEDPEDSEGYLCFIDGYPKFFHVKSKDCIYEAFNMLNWDIHLKCASTLGQWMIYADVEDFDPKYGHIGWTDYDLAREQKAAMVYPVIKEDSDDSGLEYFYISVPLPRQVEYMEYDEQELFG